jgi:hypothetical protein
MTTTFNAAATKTVRVNGTNFVYREMGDKSGIPVIFLHHLTAVLEDWDPAIADGLAKGRPVIIFDNRGIGDSEGKTPDTVADMAKDAMAFIDALGFTKVDLFGFSLGGFIAQPVKTSVPVYMRRYASRYMRTKTEPRSNTTSLQHSLRNFTIRRSMKYLIAWMIDWQPSWPLLHDRTKTIKRRKAIVSRRNYAPPSSFSTAGSTCSSSSIIVLARVAPE